MHFDEETCWAYALDALESATAADLERHMAVCDECAELVASMMENAEGDSEWNLDMYARSWKNERLLGKLDQAIQAASADLKAALRHWRERGIEAAEHVWARGGGTGNQWVWLPAGARLSANLLGGVETLDSPPPPLPSLEAKKVLELEDHSLVELTFEDNQLVARFPGRGPGNVPPVLLVTPDDDRMPPVVIRADYLPDGEWKGRARLQSGAFDVTVGPGR